MNKQPNPAVGRSKPSGKAHKGLHHHVATGGDPKNYEGCQGVNATTVPGYKGRSKS